MKAKALALALVCFGAGASAQPELAFVAPASYPEGAYWRAGHFYFTEMGADSVSIIEHGQARVFFHQEGCGPTGLAAYGEGFLILCHIGGRIVAVDAAGQEIRRWNADDEGHALRDPNDVSEDGRGGVYFSDPGQFSRNVRAEGYVLHLEAEGRLSRVAGPLWYPNGVYVDQGRAHIYVSEHMRNRVLRYALAEDGSLAERRVFADVGGLRLAERYRPAYALAGPDGLELGPDGDIYVAIYGAGLIARLTPEGDLAGQIETEARYVTNIAFDDVGGALVTGSFENIEPPFPGEVRYLPAARLTGGAD